MSNISKTVKGFTLVELLVVMGVFAIIIVTVNQILIVALKGSAKSQAISRAKLDGERVMETLERSVRYSKGVTSCPGGTQLGYKDQYGVDANLVCTPASGALNGSIVLNSVAITSSDVKVKSCDFSCDTSGGVPTAVKFEIIVVHDTVVGTSRVEEEGEVHLKSRVELRN